MGLNEMVSRLSNERAKLDVNSEHYDDAIINYDCVLAEGDIEDMEKVLLYLQKVNQISQLESELEPIYA